MKKSLMFLITAFLMPCLLLQAQTPTANRVKFKITVEQSKPFFLDTEKKISPPAFTYGSTTKNDLTVTEPKYTIEFYVTAKDLKRDHKDQFKMFLNNKAVEFECLDNGEHKIMLRSKLMLQNGFNIIFATGKNEAGESKSEWHTVTYKEPLEVVAATATGPAVEKRLALIIGNQEYTNIKKLANPINDANAMKTALENLGFDVFLGLNMTKEQLEVLVATYCSKLKTYDVGLVYYAGHGLEMEGRNYIVPVEVAKTMTDVDVPYKCTDTRWIHDNMMADNTSRNKTNIMIIDACRNNPFAENKESYKQGRMFLNAEVTAFKPYETQKAGMITAFATSQDQISIDNTSAKNGLYTSVLLKYIQEPGIPIETVFAKVRRDPQMLSANQSPVEMNKLTQDFYFKKQEDKKN